MRRLLYVSGILLLVAACHTSEDSISNDRTNENSDSLNIVSDSTLTIIDSVVVDLPIEEDSANAIIHGSPEQEKLDSIKNAKLEKKKQD